MTIDEKLRIIQRWTYAFKICQPSTGGYYGRVGFSAFSSRVYTTWNYDEYDTVIKEAFDMVNRHVLKVVRQCK